MRAQVLSKYVKYHMCTLLWWQLTWRYCKRFPEEATVQGGITQLMAFVDWLWQCDSTVHVSLLLQSSFSQALLASTCTQINLWLGKTSIRPRSPSWYREFFGICFEVILQWTFCCVSMHLTLNLPVWSFYFRLPEHSVLHFELVIGTNIKSL